MLSANYWLPKTHRPIHHGHGQVTNNELKPGGVAARNSTSPQQHNHKHIVRVEKRTKALKPEQIKQMNLNCIFPFFTPNKGNAVKRSYLL